jgi:Uma2 family endonuclease
MMASAVEKLSDSRYTYADYLNWGEDVRSEIIDGKVFMMAPPSRRHQGISGNLFYKLRDFLEGKPCKVYAAPFGVRLFPQEDKSDDTVFEPDIVVVCDASKLDDKGCNGPPDLVIEILSPATAQNDMLVKFRKYLQAGVREYWIVDGEAKTIHACVLQDGRYLTSVYGESQTAPVKVLPGCGIDLQAVFSE